MRVDEKDSKPLPSPIRHQSAKIKTKETDKMPRKSGNVSLGSRLCYLTQTSSQGQALWSERIVSIITWTRRFYYDVNAVLLIWRERGASNMTCTRCICSDVNAVCLLWRERSVFIMTWTRCVYYDVNVVYLLWREHGVSIMTWTRCIYCHVNAVYLLIYEVNVSYQFIYDVNAAMYLKTLFAHLSLKTVFFLAFELKIFSNSITPFNNSVKDHKE